MPSHSRKPDAVPITFCTEQIDQKACPGNQILASQPDWCNTPVLGGQHEWRHIVRLKGKTAIITGAAGNIGFSTAEVFLREGANVVLADLREDSLKEVCGALEGDRCVLVATDVTRTQDLQALKDTALSTFGGIDAFFANAGIEGVVAPIEEYPDDAFDKVMDVNLRSIFLGLKIIAPHIRDGGSIVMTSSIMGIAGTPMNIGYTASKHAVNGLMRSAAAAYGARGIRVNTVHPGLVESDMLRRLINKREDPKAFEESMLAKCKIPHFVEPSDIAETVAFLCSDASRYITSQMICIDAGFII